MDLAWMAWTVPTAVFFVVIAGLLCAMTIWQVVQPSIERRGFLPMATNRGDRLFIGLLGSGYIQLIWLLLAGGSLWWSLGIAIIFSILIMRWG